MPNRTVAVAVALVVATVCGCIFYMKFFDACFENGISFQNRIKPNIKKRNSDNEAIYDLESKVNPLSQVINNTHFGDILNSTTSEKGYDLNESKPFSDYGDGTCPTDQYRETFKELFVKWTIISKEFEVPYFLNFGTLLGAWRNGDLIPTDSDIDLVINIGDTPKLEKFGTRDGYRLYVQRDWKVPQDQRRRFNCKGDRVQSQMDDCSFIEPIARLINLNTNVRLDILGCIFFFDTVLIFSDLKPDVKRDIVLPLKHCKFMGIDSCCPNKPKTLLTSYYGANLRPTRVCKNKKWVKS